MCSAGCTRDEQSTGGNAEAQGSVAPSAAPARLYLPEAEPPPLSSRVGFGVKPSVSPLRCPADMVDIRGQFCIDRYESSLFDTRKQRRVSPYYHPTRAQTRQSYKFWRTGFLSSGSTAGRSIPPPEPPAWQLAETFELYARSLPDETPNGYLSSVLAAQACHNAGKRLCTPTEWVLACRGEQDEKFPYGDEYVHGRCNVFRDLHPAQYLHNHSSRHHLDPRLNLVREDGHPLLEKSGARPECASKWGDDKVYDLVGNLDEWVDDPGGRFQGGFYARPTREGCEAAVTSHPTDYFDYSLGARCCR